MNFHSNWWNIVTSYLECVICRTGINDQNIKFQAQNHQFTMFYTPPGPSLCSLTMKILHSPWPAWSRPAVHHGGCQRHRNRCHHHHPVAPRAPPPKAPAFKAPLEEVDILGNAWGEEEPHHSITKPFRPDYDATTTCMELKAAGSLPGCKKVYFLDHFQRI